MSKFRVVRIKPIEVSRPGQDLSFSFGETKRDYHPVLITDPVNHFNFQTPSFLNIPQPRLYFESNRLFQDGEAENLKKRQEIDSQKIESPDLQKPEGRVVEPSLLAIGLGLSLWMDPREALAATSHVMESNFSPGLLLTFGTVLIGFGIFMKIGQWFSQLFRSQERKDLEPTEEEVTIELVPEEPNSNPFRKDSNMKLFLAFQSMKRSGLFGKDPYHLTKLRKILESNLEQKEKGAMVQYFWGPEGIEFLKKFSESLAQNLPHSTNKIFRTGSYSNTKILIRILENVLTEAKTLPQAKELFLRYQEKFREISGDVAAYSFRVVGRMGKATHLRIDLKLQRSLADIWAGLLMECLLFSGNKKVGKNKKGYWKELITKNPTVVLGITESEKSLQRNQRDEEEGREVSYVIMTLLFRTLIQTDPSIDRLIDSLKGYGDLLDELPPGHPEIEKGISVVGSFFSRKENYVRKKAIEIYLGLMRYIPSESELFIKGMTRVFSEFERSDLWGNYLLAEDYWIQLNRLPKDHPELKKATQRLEEAIRSDPELSALLRDWKSRE